MNNQIPIKNNENMKKTSYLTGCSLLAASFLLSTGCKSAEKAVQTETATAAAAKSDSLVTAPAYTYATKQDSTIECSYDVDFPQQSDPLAQGVKQFIADKLAAIYLPYNNEDGAENDYPLYKGNPSDCAQLVRHYAEGTKQYFASLQRDMMSERLEGDWIPRFMCDVRVKKQEETKTYVTYGVSHTVYMGGAHGSYYYAETTLSKRTCRPLAQTVDTTKVMQMQTLLREGIVGYLKDNGVADAEVAYKSYLFLPDDGHFPLPVNAPSLREDGVSFVYQQYEIASYAVGLVSFVVPYSEIMPYLCDEAKALVR